MKKDNVLNFDKSMCKRRYDRIYPSENVFCLIKHNEISPFKSAKSTIINISESGIALKVTADLKLNERIIVELGNGCTKLSFEAVIVHCYASEDNESLYGCRITEDNLAIYNFIRELLNLN